MGGQLDGDCQYPRFLPHDFPGREGVSPGTLGSMPPQMPIPWLYSWQIIPTMGGETDSRQLVLCAQVEHIVPCNYLPHPTDFQTGFYLQAVRQELEQGGGDPHCSQFVWPAILTFPFYYPPPTLFPTHHPHSSTPPHPNLPPFPDPLITYRDVPLL